MNELPISSSAKSTFEPFNISKEALSITTFLSSVLRILVHNERTCLISLISGTYYPPRSKKIINLISRIKKDKFTKSTLGGCILEEKDNFILISKELKTRKMQYQPEK